MLVRRSILILPANHRRFVEKAHTRGADAIMLDLEDAIAPHKKEEARQALPEAVRLVGQGGADVLVRINHPWELAYLDLDAAVISGVTCIHLPKVEAPEDVYAIDRMIEDRELRQGLPPRAVQLAVSMETARGLMRDKEIVRASPRIKTVTSGIEDLATDLEVQLTDEGWELFYTKARVVLVARDAGLEPLGLVGRISDYKDLESFRQSALRARRLGYRGSGCIHPDQVTVLNEVFSPTPAEVEWSRKVLETAVAAASAGRGAWGLDGHMIDAPVVTRARRFLERARIIAEREGGLG